MNSQQAQHPFIKFTVTHSDNDTHSIDFLDLTISINSKCVLQWQLFIKLSHSSVHLPFLSSAPMPTQHAMAKNQYARAIANSSTEAGKRSIVAKITQLLKANAYPKQKSTERSRMPPVKDAAMIVPQQYHLSLGQDGGPLDIYYHSL